MKIRAIRPIFFFTSPAAAVFLFSLLLLVMIHPARAAVDDGIFAELLKKHVTNGEVDYAGFKKDETRLDRYLAVLEKTDTRTLTKTEQFAFYVSEETLFVTHCRSFMNEC